MEDCGGSHEFCRALKIRLGWDGLSRIVAVQEFVSK
jgi:hypothetical protein